MTGIVLVVGASAKIGFHAIFAARQVEHNVLVVIRNEQSRKKLLQLPGSKAGVVAVAVITTLCIQATVA